MAIQENLIKELQAIFKAEYGRDISLAETEQVGNSTVGCFDNLSKMYHGNKAAIDRAYEERISRLPTNQ